MPSVVSTCSSVVSLLMLVLVAYALYLIFNAPAAGENDGLVIQRQIRGLSLIVISNLIMVLSMLVCTGSLNILKKLF